jgi:hypothetical protein
MIELKPQPENYFICPECQSGNLSIHDIIVPSINVMADCGCKNCGFEFYQVYPVGHCMDDQLSIGKRHRKFYNNHDEESWLYKTFCQGHRTIRTREVFIRKVINQKKERVIILNTLDYLYGHVLLKLYNAVYHLDNHKDLGLIVIVPKIFEWLVPKECAEAWIVDLKLSELIYWHQGIQDFTANEFKRFSKIYLSKSYSHPELAPNTIKRLTGIAPFDLSQFQQITPTVTFVVREDRWWLPGAKDYWFYRLCRFFDFLPWGSRVLSWRQNRLIKSTIRSVRRKLPRAKFIIVGLGNTGSFDDSIQDERTLMPNTMIETAWCATYARSHVVVGVHGSNMLLPTALAAGCVEILPQDRYGNMVQDISVRYSDRKQLFFYRFVDQYASPKSVAAKIVSIISDFNMYDKNMCQNVYSRRTAADTAAIVQATISA